MIIDNNFLSKDECSYYVNKANKNVEPYDWDKRVVFIHDDTSLILKTINYFKQYNLFYTHSNMACKFFKRFAHSW